MNNLKRCNSKIFLFDQLHYCPDPIAIGFDEDQLLLRVYTGLDPVLRSSFCPLLSISVAVYPGTELVEVEGRTCTACPTLYAGVQFAFIQSISDPVFIKIINCGI